MTDPDHVAAARAVYDHSAEHYVDAVGTAISPRFEAAVDRGLLDAFAEQIRTLGPGPVADIGCGSGRVTAYLDERGLHAAGFDISSGMVKAARAAHPHLPFEEGALTAIPVPSRSLIGAVYWYSIIATPPDELVAVWDELLRVLQPRALVLIGFQAGHNDHITRPDAYGSNTTLTLYQHAPDDINESLTAAGFDIACKVLRKQELPHESTPQAFVLASPRGSQ